MAETNRPVFGEPKQRTLFEEGAALMGKGALIGAAIAFLPVVFIWLFVALGETLPPESKEAPDPSFDPVTNGSLEIPQAGPAGRTVA